MAKSKRPQRSVHAGGVPTTQIQTGVNPVDTFVNPGLVGMPQQTEGTVAPNQPDMQKARDLAALGQAFQGLSSSLGEYGMSEARLDNKIEEWGREQAGLDSAQRITGQKMAVAADAKWIDYIDHPRFQSGRSEARMGIAVNDFHNNIMADLTKHRASNSDLDTIEGSMKWYDSMVQGMAWPKMSRPDVGERTLIKAQSAGRKIFENAQRKYLGEKGVNESLQAIGTAVRNTTKSALLEIIDPSVSMGTNAYGIPVVKAVNPADPADVFKERLAIASEEITAFIDGQLGGVLTPDLVNETVGKVLVDFALDTRSPEEAKFAEELLKIIKTGPKGARGNLLGINAVEEYYSSKDGQLYSREEQIARRKESAANQAYADFLKEEKRIFKTNIDVQNEANVDRFLQTLISGGGTVTDERLLALEKETMGGARKGNIGGGASLTVEGNHFVVKKTMSDGTVVDGRIDLVNNIAHARSLYWDNRKANHREFLFSKNGKDQLKIYENKNYSPEMVNAALDVATMVETNMVPPSLRSDMSLAMQGVGRLRDNLEKEEYDTIEESPTFQAFRVGLAAVTAAEKTGNTTYLSKLIPDEGQRAFWTVARMLRNDPVVARHGGGSDAAVYRMMIGEKEVSPISLNDFVRRWEEEGVPAIQAIEEGGFFSKGTPFANIRLAQDRISKVAKTLYIIGAEPNMSKSITRAIIDYKDHTEKWGGYLVSQDEIDMELLNNGLPEDFDYEVRIDSELGLMLESFGLRELTGTYTGTALNLLDIIDVAWYEGVQNKNRSEQKYEIFSKIYKQSKEFLKTKHRAGTVPDLLESVKVRFKNAPPEDWVKAYPTHEIEDIKFQMEPGSEGWSYFATIYYSNGEVIDSINPYTKRTYTLHELRELDKEGKRGANTGLPTGAPIEEKIISKKSGEKFDATNYVNVTSFMSMLPSKAGEKRGKRSHWMTRQDFIQYSGPASGSRAWEELKISILREEDEDLMGPTYD